MHGSPSLAGRSACPAYAEADREAHDPQEDQHTADAVTVMDGDEHSDSYSDQGNACYKPESDEPLPTVVDGRTVVRARICRASTERLRVIPEHWPNPVPSCLNQKEPPQGSLVNGGIVERHLRCRA
jgi:hypothetical protein